MDTSRTQSDGCVSVVILNHNRKELLRQSVSSVRKLAWPDLEIIVVDNASTDGSPEMIEAEFGPAVRVLRRQDSGGNAGRNAGFRAARGEYVLSLDNDMVVPPETIHRALAIFDQLPRVGALAFKIGTAANPCQHNPGHWWHPRHQEGWENKFFFTDFFAEGAVFFCAEALRATGGYAEDFVQHFESVDLALKLIREGFDILYCPILGAAELDARGPYTHKRVERNYYLVRNRLWTAWKHYPLWRGIGYGLTRVGMAGLRALRYGWVGHFLRAVKDGAFPPASIRRQRRPLPQEVWQKIDRIRNGRYGEPLGVERLGEGFRRASTAAPEQETLVAAQPYSPEKGY